MNKIHIGIAALIISLGVCRNTAAQTNGANESAPTAAEEHFEGIIRYGMQVEGQDISPEVKAMIPKEFTIYLKDARSRLEMQTSMSNVTVLGDNSNNNAITLMDVMGQKLAIKTDSAQLNEVMGRFGEYEIRHVDGEKEILGYHCKKALIIRNDAADTSEVWYTNELLPVYPNVSQFLPKGNWFPMEVHAVQEGVETVLTVEEISEKRLDDSLFKVPEGYKIMQR